MPFLLPLLLLLAALFWLGWSVAIAVSALALFLLGLAVGARALRFVWAGLAFVVLASPFLLVLWWCVS